MNVSPTAYVPVAGCGIVTEEKPVGAVPLRVSVTVLAAASVVTAPIV